jgi:hypothetical protein
MLVGDASFDLTESGDAAAIYFSGGRGTISIQDKHDCAFLSHAGEIKATIPLPWIRGTCRTAHLPISFLAGGIPMDGPTLFDKYVRTTNLGPRIVGSAFPPPVAEEYDRYLRRVRSFVDSAKAELPRLTPVYADFVQNPEFNAQAVPAGGMHLIVIFDGMPVVTTAIVRRMLADCRLFRHVGNVGVEADALPLYSRITPNASELLKTITAVAPKDDHRLIYCYHLQNTVFDFIAAHELTHIAHGHIAYMNAEYGRPMIDELNWKPGTPKGSLEVQTMEMDADFNSAKLMMQTIDRLWKERATLPPPMKEYYADRPKAVYDAGVAICIMCRMFGDESISGVDLTRSEHPPMRWRQMWILNTLGNYVEQLWGEDLVQPGTDAISRALTDVEEAFETITGGKQSVEGLHEAWGPAGRDYAQSLADSWNGTLKAKLPKYAYIDKMPHYGFDFPSPTLQRF